MHADVGGEAQQESAIIRERSPISVPGITGTSFQVAFLKPCERRMVWGRVLICASSAVFSSNVGMNIFLFKGLVDVGQFDFDIIPSWLKREKVVPFWLYMWLYTVCHLKIESHIMQAAMSSVDVSVLLVGLSQTLPAAHCWLVGSLPNISELDPPKLILCWHVNKGYFHTSRTSTFFEDLVLTFYLGYRSLTEGRGLICLPVVQIYSFQSYPL